MAAIHHSFIGETEDKAGTDATAAANLPRFTLSYLVFNMRTHDLEVR